jgi:hypothetical protein
MADIFDTLDEEKPKSRDIFDTLEKEPSPKKPASRTFSTAPMQEPELAREATPKYFDVTPFTKEEEPDFTQPITGSSLPRMSIMAFATPQEPQEEPTIPWDSTIPSSKGWDDLNRRNKEHMIRYKSMVSKLSKFMDKDRLEKVIDTADMVWNRAKEKHELMGKVRTESQGAITSPGSYFDAHLKAYDIKESFLEEQIRNMGQATIGPDKEISDPVERAIEDYLNKKEAVLYDREQQKKDYNLAQRMALQFGKGGVRGGQTVLGGVYGTGRMGAEALGAEGVAEDLRGISRDLNNAGKEYSADVTFNEIASPGDFFEWMSGFAGEQAPYVLATAGPGTVLATSGKLASTAGVMGSTWAIETGNLYNDIAPDVEGSSKDKIVASGAGLVISALNSIADMKLLQRFGIFDDVAKQGVAKSLAKNKKWTDTTREMIGGFLKHGAIEGTTETSQEWIGETAKVLVDENRELFDEKHIKDMWNVTPEIFVGSMLFGGLTGATGELSVDTDRRHQDVVQKMELYQDVASAEMTSEESNQAIEQGVIEQEVQDVVPTTQVLPEAEVMEREVRDRVLEEPVEPTGLPAQPVQPQEIEAVEEAEVGVSEEVERTPEQREQEITEAEGVSLEEKEIVVAEELKPTEEEENTVDEIVEETVEEDVVEETEQEAIEKLPEEDLNLLSAVDDRIAKVAEETVPSELTNTILESIKTAPVEQNTVRTLTRSLENAQEAVNVMKRRAEREGVKDIDINVVPTEQGYYVTISVPPSIEKTTLKARKILKKAVKDILNGPSTDIVTTTPKSLLKYAKMYEARGSRAGYVAGKADVKATQNELIDFVTTHLPIAERGRFLRAVMTASGPKAMAKVVESVNLVQDKLAQREALKKFRKIKPTKTQLKQMRPEFRKQIEIALKGFSGKSLSGKSIRRLNSLIKASQDTDIDLELVNAAKVKLAENPEIPLSKRSAETIETVTNAIQNIIHQNKLKNQLIFGRQLRDNQLAADVVKESLSKQKQKGGEIDHKAGLLRTFMDKHIGSIEAVKRVDGSEDGIFKYIQYDALKEGERRKYKEIQEGIDNLENAAVNAGYKWGSKELTKISREASGKLKTKALKLKSGDTVKMTPAELIHFVLADTETKREYVKAGAKLSRRRGGKTFKIDMEDFTRAEALLNNKEMQLATAMKDYLNTNLKPKINETFVKLQGYEKAFRDDYWPRKRDDFEKQTETMPGISQWSKKNLDNQGIFKERTGSKSPVLIEDAVELYYKHINQVAATVGMSIPIRNAAMLLGHSDVKKGILNTYGKGMLDYFNDRLEAATGMEKPVTGFIQEKTRNIQNTLSTAYLGYNPKTRMKQSGGLFTVAPYVGVNVFNNYGKTFGTKQLGRVWELIKDHSPELRHRYETTGVHLMSPMFGEQKSYLGQKPKSEKYMKGLEKADRRIVTAIWMTVEENNPSWSNEQVARETERLTNMTQNITSVLDMAGMQLEARKSPLARMSVMFMSQANRVVNLMAHTMWQARNGKISLSEAAYRMAMIGVGNAAVVVAVNEMFGYLYRGFRGRDDEKEVLDYGIDLIDEMVGNFFLVGPVFRAISKSLDNKFWWDDSLDNPGERVVKDAVEAIKALKQMSEDDRYTSGFKKGQKKAPDAFMKGLEKLFYVVTAVKGIPQTPLRVGKGLYRAVNPGGYAGLSDVQLRLLLQQKPTSKEIKKELERRH